MRVSLFLCGARELQQNQIDLQVDARNILTYLQENDTIISSRSNLIAILRNGED